MSLLHRLRAFCIFVTFAGCKHPEPTKDAPLRVVSLSPSTTEAMFAVGAGEVLVGRSRFCDYPASATKLPQVGGFVDANLEAIVGLRPSLVVGARGPAGDSVTKRLNQLGIQTYFPPTESTDEVQSMMISLGEQTHHKQEGARAVAEMNRALAALDEALSKAPKVRAILVFGTNPVVVAGVGTYANEMLLRAHGVNLVVGTGYPALPAESLAALDPDVILDAVMGGDEPRVTPTTPGFSSLRAVREGRVVPLKEASILRPGPRLAEGAKALAHALHPEVTLP